MDTRSIILPQNTNCISTAEVSAATSAALPMCLTDTSAMLPKCPVTAGVTVSSVCLTIWRHSVLSAAIVLSIPAVSQKKKRRHPFHFCDNLVICHSILPILGRNIPPGNWTMNETILRFFTFLCCFFIQQDKDLLNCASVFPESCLFFS